MTQLLARRRDRSRRGYAMLVALVLIALLTIIGATSLSVAGVDQRVATHNRRHMMVLNTADAGTEHARFLLQSENPRNESARVQRIRTVSESHVTGRPAARCT